MARIARNSYENSYFHVIVQGYEKKYIFCNDVFKEKYLKLLLEEMENFKVEVLEYCIMDNHAHILLYCEKIEEMGKYMRSVNTQYAMFYNKENAHVGYVFRDRYLSEPIKNENYLYSCMAYVHMNPVVARMVARPEQYKFSSYNDFLNKTGVVTDSVLIKLFGSSEKYLDLFKFIHFETGIGMEYKNDLPKMSIERARVVINDILKESCIECLTDEDVVVQRYFFRLFIRLGVSIYQMEKIVGMDHRTIKRRIIV